MKAFKYSPQQYAGSDVESIAPAINIGYIILPSFLTIFFIQQVYERDFGLILFLGISILFTIFIRYQFVQGQLRKSVVSAVFFFNILLTAVCTLGNGINDIAIIGFPIIIGFSGIILDQKKLAIASGLSIASVAWLVIGERLNIYTPHILRIGDPGDFMVSSLLILMGGYVAFSLTSNMKHALRSAQEEVAVSKREAENLEKETNEKLEIIEEIHRAVINSLNHVQQLIHHKQGESKSLIPVYEGLKRKVMVIEVAHRILLSEQTPIMLDIREFTLKLLDEYKKELNTSKLIVDISDSAHPVRLDLAINFGICLFELLSEVTDVNNKSIAVGLDVGSDVATLKLNGFVNHDFQKHGIVMELLTKQLRGELHKASSEYALTFNPSVKQ